MKVALLQSLPLRELVMSRSVIVLVAPSSLILNLTG